MIPITERIHAILASPGVIGFDRGLRLRELLNKIAKKKYKPMHTPERYMEFMSNNEVSFTVNHPQCSNYPQYLSMFSEVSQHVYGDCTEECLDRAIYRGNHQYDIFEHDKLLCKLRGWEA